VTGGQTKKKRLTSPRSNRSSKQEGEKGSYSRSVEGKGAILGKDVGYVDQERKTSHKFKKGVWRKCCVMGSNMWNGVAAARKEVRN